MRTEELEAFYSRPGGEILADARLPLYHEELLCALEAGSVRAARRNGEGVWEPCAWVKRAILCGFRFSGLAPFEAWPGGARDKAAYPPRVFGSDDEVRLVPGGSAVRRGAFIGKGVVVMSPAYVNVGAYVGARTMHVNRPFLNRNPRILGLKLVQALPVGSRLLAIQQACAGEDEGAGADRHDPPRAGGRRLKPRGDGRALLERGASTGHDDRVPRLHGTQFREARVCEELKAGATADHAMPLRRRGRNRVAGERGIDRSELVGLVEDVGDSGGLEEEAIIRHDDEDISNRAVSSTRHNKNIGPSLIADKRQIDHSKPNDKSSPSAGRHESPRRKIPARRAL